MKALLARLGLVSLTLLFAALLTSPVHAQQNPVFPGSPVETITQPDGSVVEVYSAVVESVRGNRVTVRFPSGERHTYSPPADFRFEVDGQMLRTSQLQRRQTLRAYVTRHPERGHSLVQIEDTSAATPVYVPVVQPEPEADMLPATASNLPLAGLLGGALVALGAFGFGIRRRLN
jgi:hypothetical protein